MTSGSATGKGHVGRLARRIPTLLRTVRPLRGRQALAQLHHALFGIAPPRRVEGPPPRLAIPAPATPYLPPPAHVKSDGPGRFELLATPFALPHGAGWRESAHGPLFAYHLHQHEYLRLPEIGPGERAAAIRDWIASNASGIGWDPHPTGLRLLTWGKLLTTPGCLPDDPELRAELLRAFADQAETLSRNLEWRLQANHLLSNLICVVFAGMLVEAEPAAAWRLRASLLMRELERQIHADGGHEERSPMYHAALLEGLLDLLNLCRVAAPRAPRGLEAALSQVAPRMVLALECLSHRDGQIALLADSAYGIAAEPARLRDYAERLGACPSAGARRGERATTDGAAALEGREGGKGGSVLLADTGYVRLESSDWLLIASVAGPAPAHQPGHAHCDALGFELSLGRHRLVADTGVYEYVVGERRTRSRSTASHATIQIDDEEQAEIWAAHRVGGRPEVVLARFDAEGEVEGGTVEATCRGWSRPRTLHRRRFRIRDRTVEIVDSVVGPARRLRSRVPIAPGWAVSIEPIGRGAASGVGAIARCQSAVPGGPTVEIELPDAFSWRVESGPWYPTFGRALERPVLVGDARACADARMRFRLPG